MSYNYNMTSNSIYKLRDQRSNTGTLIFFLSYGQIYAQNFVNFGKEKFDIHSLYSISN